MSDDKTRSQNAYVYALAETLRTLRRHPDFPQWWRARPAPGVTEATWIPPEPSISQVHIDGVIHRIDHTPPRPDFDTSHAEHLATWARRIEGYLMRKPSAQRERWMEHLLDTTEAHIEAQTEQLANTWAAVVGTEVWAGLPLAGKWLYAAVHAQSGERDHLGGPSVLLSNRAALAVIAILGGPAWRSLQVITCARVALVKAGLLTTEVGQQWEKGTRATPTRYELPLTPTKTSKTAPPAPGNNPLKAPDRDCSYGSWKGVPRYTREQRAVVDAVFGELKQQRAAEPESVDIAWADGLLGGPWQPPAAPPTRPLTSLDPFGPIEVYVDMSEPEPVVWCGHGHMVEVEGGSGSRCAACRRERDPLRPPWGWLGPERWSPEAKRAAAAAVVASEPSTEESVMTEHEHEPATEQPPRVCPAGHSGDDIMELLTPSGEWWPACVRCLSTPMPGDAASWSAESEGSEGRTLTRPTPEVSEGLESARVLPARAIAGDLPHSCQCGDRWGGSRTAHCRGLRGGCHYTFADGRAEARHRRGGRCEPPDTVGMARLAGHPFEVWGPPELAETAPPRS